MLDIRKKLPGVLLLLLSALGFLFSIGSILLTWVGFTITDPGELAFGEMLPVVTAALLSLTAAALHIPAFTASIRYLNGKSLAVRWESLFLPASISLAAWAAAVASGYFAAVPARMPVLLAALTVIAVVIPIWWLVEFSRRGLPRSNAPREWGALTVGLTVAPLIIMLVELLLVALVGVGVFIALSAQPGAMQRISEIFQNMDLVQGSLEQSNVNPLLLTTEIIEIKRAYASYMKTMKAYSDLSEKRNQIGQIG